MTCDERDQELLLLAHGALPLSRRLAVLAHLRKCAACRKRYDRMAQVSSALAAALSPPTPLSWTPAWNGKSAGATFGTRMLTMFSVLLIILAVTILYLAFSKPATVRRNSAAPTALKSSDGCSPYLSNDHCR